jgi:hypothetical protein
MARKKLSVQGRVAAAGVSVAIAGSLAGFMAAGDHTADATQSHSSSSSSSSSPGSSNGYGTSDTPSGSTATPYPSDPRGLGDDSGQFQPQPQTRTGGS